jgi:hypothetical protein
MKRTQRPEHGRTVFDLIEEATHVLRTAPAATLAVYFAGAIPFVLGFLFFWADMSRSPLAPQHLAEASLGMAALFFWMKFCQAIFARRVRAQVAHEPPAPWKFRTCARILVTQAMVQPSGLFILPLAIIPILPFAWTYAFYQNVTALDDGTKAGSFAVVNHARRQARLSLVQNGALILILAGFAGCVFLNWMTVCLSLPELFKMFFGVESVFTQSPMAMMNTTFFAAMAGLTYLCVDPLAKTAYTLRCFYGEAMQSGEDLKAELKPFVRAHKTAGAILIFLMLGLGAPAMAEPAPAAVNPAVSQTIPPPGLDQAINQTIHERKYVWRMPRQQAVQTETQEGVIARLFHTVGAMIRDWVRAALHWVGKVLEKLLRGLFGHQRTTTSTSSGYAWIESLQVLLYGLVAAAVAALAIFLYRLWRNRSRPAPEVAGQAIQPLPDVADENVRADQLPEDGWAKLGRELLERGEFRLAMRAFYLASLAHLAARNLISIARFKSNRDYERELRRRAHAFPGLLSVFDENLALFEGIWYGMHDVSADGVNQFAANLERLKAGA